MTTSADLIEVIVEALCQPGATDAADRVYRPGDWPTQNGQYPIIKLRVPRENKQSIGRSGGPQFTVTSTIRVVGEVSAPADVNDAGAAAAEAALWQLQRQIEVAIIGSYPLERMIQQIGSVDIQLSYNSDAETHLAGVQIDFGLEFYQGPEDFAPIEADDIDEVDVDVSTYPPAGFTADLTQ